MVRFVYCADDFTGASDTLATLARSGLKTRLYLNAPTPDPAVNDPAPRHDLDDLDAFGVATSLRALGVDDGVATIGPIADTLAQTDCRLYHLKICSTFDSGPAIGNVAATADRFASGVDANWVAIIGGQPSLGRYCFGGNLFALSARGDLHRIDRHPVMATHPVTPMNEADLTRHFASQGWDKVGLIDVGVIRNGVDAVIANIADRRSHGETRTLFDVSDDSDLTVIGDALHTIAQDEPILCVGASSVAQALFPVPVPSQFGPVLASLSTARVTPAATNPARRKGPVFAFAGSRSAVTADQVAHAQNFVKRSIAPVAFADITATDGLITECLDVLTSGKNLLVSLSDDRNHTLGAHDLARASAAFIANICQGIDLGFLAIAGGDTSSLAVQTLGIESLSFMADFDRGVPLICAHAENTRLDGLPMLLKGGQMGQIDMFDNICALPIVT
ncbi:four-carbon acid sugar kinase family protein [Thalassospira sp. MA62]|nr:four-carbon acid sugar kinase family protein [Thalassospira sp. MA62]